jgi:hypothetical protein
MFDKFKPNAEKIFSLAVAQKMETAEKEMKELSLERDELVKKLEKIIAELKNIEIEPSDKIMNEALKNRALIENKLTNVTGRIQSLKSLFPDNRLKN